MVLEPLGGKMLPKASYYFSVHCTLEYFMLYIFFVFTLTCGQNDQHFKNTT